MFEYISSGGVMMIPILLCSIIAVAVVVNLFLSLKRQKVMPSGVANTARKLAMSGQINPQQTNQIRDTSLLGEVLAAGLDNIESPRHILKENVEEKGRHVVHSMDKYMTTLGTISVIAPMLGLLGTVVGMISVFSVITSQGVGNPTELAGGISQALITTAGGIVVAVPALIFHRHFRGKINDYAIEMEKEAIKLVDAAVLKNQNKSRVNNQASTLKKDSALDSVSPLTRERAIAKAKQKLQAARGVK